MKLRLIALAALAVATFPCFLALAITTRPEAASRWTAPAPPVTPVPVPATAVPPEIQAVPVALSADPAQASPTAEEPEHFYFSRAGFKRPIRLKPEVDPGKK